MKRVSLLLMSFLFICAGRSYGMELSKDRKCKSEQTIYSPTRATKTRKSVSFDGLFTQERLSKRVFLSELCKSPAYLKNKGWNELHVAVRKKDINEIQQILKKHEDDLSTVLNARDKEGNTPLWLAALEYNSTEGDRFTAIQMIAIIQMLVQAGACVNVKNNEQYELLNWVSEQGLIDVLDVLLASETADVNKKDIGGVTPLVAASWSPKERRRKTLKKLINAHANRDELKSANPEALTYLPDQQQDHMHGNTPEQPKKSFIKRSLKKTKNK